MSESKSPWEVLAHRVKKDVDQCRRDWRAAQARADALTSSLTRIEAMIKEYEQDLVTPREAGQRMCDEWNTRRFLEQVRALHSRTQADKRHADQVCCAAATALSEQERERLKVNILIDTERKNNRRRSEIREQKNSDEWALIRYRWRDS